MRTWPARGGRVVVMAVLLAVTSGTMTAEDRAPAPPFGAVTDRAPDPLSTSAAREAIRLVHEQGLKSRRPVAARKQPQKRWIARHPILFGALVGFGAGCVIGASQVGGSEDHFFNALDEFACPGVGGIGAGAGAALGWAVSR